MHAHAYTSSACVPCLSLVSYLWVLPAAKEVGVFLGDPIEALSEEILGSYLSVVTGPQSCYRQHYQRIGTIPDMCGHRENPAGFCDDCREGWKRTGFNVCQEKCWEGWQDHGLLCHLPMHSYWVSAPQGLHAIDGMPQWIWACCDGSSSVLS